MNRILLTSLTILILGSSLFISCITEEKVPKETITIQLTTQTSIPQSRGLTVDDMIDDSYYWNSSWDATDFYHTLISINRSYHQNHTYIEDVFDCDNMVVDLWNILYEQGIISVIGVGNLAIGGEKLMQSDHAWLIVFHKDILYRVYAIETTNGEIYAMNPETKAFGEYFEGYYFASPSDFRKVFIE